MPNAEQIRLYISNLPNLVSDPYYAKAIQRPRASDLDQSVSTVWVSVGNADTLTVAGSFRREGSFAGEGALDIRIAKKKLRIKKPSKEKAMDTLNRRERLRRVALLCCHFSRNLAYYRAWHQKIIPGEYGEFLATVDGNFIDMAVIEWCKLFGDKRGKHHWRKVVTNPGFEAAMFERFDEAAGQFTSYIQELRQYRDKFLAHLDDHRVMHVPRMDLANGSVQFLYIHLVSDEASMGDLTGLPQNLAIYYEGCLNTAKSFLERTDLELI